METTMLTGEEAAALGFNRESHIARSFYERLHDHFGQSPGIKFLGIMGDKRHQRKRSSHNCGMALDFFINDMGIMTLLLEEIPHLRIVDYVIFGDRFYKHGAYNAYTKADHWDHMHISFRPEYRDKRVKRWNPTFLVR